MPKPADWEKVKTRWEAGEDLKGLAIRTGRSEASIEAKAIEEKWDSKRRPTIARTQAKGERKSAAIVLTESTPTLFDRVRMSVDPDELANRLDAETANANHLHDHELLRQTALVLMGVAAEKGDGRLFTSVANAIKTAQDGQRKCLGLDKKADNEAPTDAGGIVYLPHKAPLPDDGITPIIPSDAANPDGD